MKTKELKEEIERFGLFIQNVCEGQFSDEPERRNAIRQRVNRIFEKGRTEALKDVEKMINEETHYAEGFGEVIDPEKLKQKIKEMEK